MKELRKIVREEIFRLDESIRDDYLTELEELDTIKQKSKNNIAQKLLDVYLEELEPILTKQDYKYLPDYVYFDNEHNVPKKWRDSFRQRKENYLEQHPETQKIVKDAQKQNRELSAALSKRILKLSRKIKDKYGDEALGIKGDMDAKYIYHFTRLDNALDILKDNLIIGQDHDHGVSFTTNKDLVKKEKPVFYQPSKHVRGTTYENLSVQFKLDFEKIQTDYEKIFAGNEDTAEGEQEIRIKLGIQEEGLVLDKYLESIVIDTTRIEDSKKLDKFLDKLESKNIDYYLKTE